MKILIATLFVLLLVFQVSLFLFNFHFFQSPFKPYKMGLVYSTTGFRAEKEKNALEAALMAIEEINQQGGIHGRSVQPIIVDAQSDWNKAKNKIEQLIIKDRVDVIVGGWTNASRYTTKQLFEKHKHLLISPFQYEGLITSPNIIWVGATLNQQVTPTIAYILQHIGKSIYLVGSDYLLSHMIHMMAKDQLQALGGEIVGEKYLEPNSLEIDNIIQDIISRKPKAILNSLTSENNKIFFKKLRQAGVESTSIPTFSLTIDEVFLEATDLKDLIGEYATWNYFQSIDTSINHLFVKEFKKFSTLKSIDNSAESSYLGVHLWAQAVSEGETTDPQALSYILASMSQEAPEGLVMMDMEGKRAWKFSRIGQVQPDGQFKIVWQSKKPIKPMPFEIYRSQAEWDKLSDYLYKEIVLPTPNP
jgi:urea transport system substrate-binding protein